MIYDVVIFGGGTSGVACAYVSAKLGLKTLLVEKSDVLGGSITQALVIPCMNIDDCGINNQFFSDLIVFSKKYGAQVTYGDGNQGWFNPELLKVVFEDMLSSVNCDILYSTEPTHIDNISLNKFYIDMVFKMLSLHIEASYIVDATGFGKIFNILNFDFQNKNKISQTPTLRFNISNVNLEIFRDWIMNFDSDRNVTTSYVIDNQIHLSTACTSDIGIKWALKPIFEKAINNGDLEEEEAAYFQVFTIPLMPTTVALNCPKVFPDGDISDPFVYSKAIQQARKKILHLHSFCKKYLPGFENSYISHIADMFGIREDYRVMGKYTYTYSDMQNSKEFENIAFCGNYPIDIHTNCRNAELCKEKYAYSVPIDVLVSKENDRVFAIGRCLSADFKAQSALRIQRHCFSMGEAVSKYIYNKINQSK